VTHQVTEESRKIVETASGVGLAQDTIATLIGVTGKTLRRRYRKELTQGMAKAHFNISKTTYEQAIKGDRTMLIWYEKTRMGMRETVQLTTPPGEPLETKSGEAELIGAYYKRLAAAGIDPGGAAPGSPARADPSPDQRVGEAGQGPSGQGGRKAPDQS
jgi:hypothetical protein